MLPIAALGAAAAVGLVVITRSDAPADSGADDILTEEDGATVSATTTPPSGLSARTLSWQAELADQAPELDTSVLLRWVQRESDGNPAAVGSIKQVMRDGWAREAGIGQVYFESRGQRVFGVTSDELRAGAIAGTQNTSRDLTEPERQLQTSSLIEMCRQYIRDGGAVLAELGVTWEAADIYALAKLKHALPVLVNTYLRHCPDPSSWDSFRAWLEALTLAESLDIWNGAKAYTQDNEGNYQGWTRYLNNAQYTGRGD